MIEGAEEVKISLMPIWATGQEELDHGCQSNGKGTERNHKKKGGLSSVYSYLVFAEAPGNAENQLTYLFQSETSCLALTMVS